jgi:hypothetical protein
MHEKENSTAGTVASEITDKNLNVVFIDNVKFKHVLFLSRHWSDFHPKLVRLGNFL